MNELLDGQEVAQAEGADAPQPETVEEADLIADGVDDATADAETSPPDDQPDPLEALLSNDELRSKLFEHPSVVEKLRERENAGANRREAQLKRDAGKKDVTVQNVRRFFAEVGAEADEAKFGYLYDLAAANSAMELATAIPEAVLRKYTIPADVREQAISAREQGDWDGYISTYIESAAEQRAEQLFADRKKQLDAENQKWRSAELKAMQASQAERRPGAIPAPAGGVAKSGPTPAEYRSASRSQREQWRREGVEPVLA